MTEDDVNQLAAGLRGGLVRRSDPGYDEVRRLHNAMIDKRPLLIARCVDAADVMAAVNFARDQGLKLAVRGGGHNGPGLGSVDDGLLIDLSVMRGVRVDPRAKTARVAGGATVGDVDHATHPFGLAVPFGIISTTGVGGLTLSGGHGYLTRQHGLTIDNLIEADVVTAEGRPVTASAEENPDLFWGMRGGGGNFGVVTSFLFRAHPADTLYAGPIFFDLRDAPTVARWYRDFQASAPEAFYVFLGLQTVPSVDPFPRDIWSRKICVLLLAHNGPTNERERDVKALRAALPKPILDWAGPMPYTALQSLFDGLYPKGLQWYWKGDFVRTLPDAAIEVHLEHAAEPPSELSAMHLYPIDGAVHRKAADDTAWNCRDATWSMVIIAVDADANKAPRLKQWASRYFDAVHPYDLAGAYPNFMMADEGEARLRASYGGNYQRLWALKSKYDPANLFSVNQNILPYAALDEPRAPAASGR